MSDDPLTAEEIGIIRSMTLSQRFGLGCLLNQRARQRYREKLARELPEWTDEERGRLLRAATIFGIIDTAEPWLDVYHSAEFQADLRESSPQTNA